MPPSKGLTEFYRLGLLVGFLRPARTAAWIDGELGVPAGASPLAERLASGEGSEHVVRDAAARLEAVPGEAAGAAPVRVLLGLMAKKLEHDSSLGPRTLVMLSRLRLLAALPAEVAAVEDRFAAAGAAQEAATAELLALLRRYEPDADGFIASGDV